MIKWNDMIEQKIGKLLIIKRAEDFIENDGKHSIRMSCLCDCGTYKDIRKRDICNGGSKSCGCVKKINDSEIAKRSTAKIIFTTKYSDGDLTFDEFLLLTQQNCFYCGIFPNNTANQFLRKSKRSSEFSKQNGYFTYNGLDRIDSNEPHNKNNLVTCCKHCNYAKRDRSLEEFRQWIIKINEHFIVKNL